MVGRKLKQFSYLTRPIYFEFEDGSRYSFGTIMILCPDCGSNQVRTFGTHIRKKTRVEYFRCYNSECSSFKSKGGRQFCMTSSKLFQEMIWMKLQKLGHNLMENGIKYSALAEQYQLSISEISALRYSIQNAIIKQIQSIELVEVPQPDQAIAIDETYIKIDGKTLYVILATGYATHKCLGLKVSKTREEQDLREVFDEADKNVIDGISTITSDALNATQAMAKNLGREITIVIHKHKTPYDKVVIRHFSYQENVRTMGEIGVKTDIFTHRKKREFYWREVTESIMPRVPKKKGRPLGKWKRKKKIPKKRLKRGRKGLFTVFDKGKKAYLKVDPARLNLQISGNVPMTVDTGLHETFKLFAGMSIQNNLSEHLNSLIKALLGLSGPKQADSISTKIRITLRVWNQPELLNNVKIDRHFHGGIFLRGLNIRDFPHLSKLGWNLENNEKKNNGGNLSFV
jgi:transposase-like protein